MGDEKDDVLGLSLSLGCAQNSRPTPSTPFFPLNLMQSQSSLFGSAFQSSFETNAETRSFLRGIDVNQADTAIDCDEELMVSSPNSTVSSVSGKRCEREENEAERGSSSFEDDGGDAAARKKLRLSKEQAAVLEETFKDHSTLNPKQKLALAKQLNLRPRQVEVWFQNRRARTKLKQTEFDCEYLRRCCKKLTEENKRLHKEVNELRALKLSPQLYTNMNPPTTLTMCPQCERVSSSSSSASTSLSLGSTSAGANRQHNQRPIALNSWARFFPPKSADAVVLNHNS